MAIAVVEAESGELVESAASSVKGPNSNVAKNNGTERCVVAPTDAEDGKKTRRRKVRVAQALAIEHAICYGRALLAGR